MKLGVFEKWTTEKLTESLAPGLPNALKCRQDGTMLDGHHRIAILRSRGLDVNALPRETVERTDASA